jgi:RHS repeat-associated protein
MVGRVVPNAPQDEFIPQFDDDGNQTLIKTDSGVWQVQYNGENRPIVWKCVSTNSPTHNSFTPPLITMSYDRMARRVTKNAQRFVYDGYLCIGKIEDSTSIHYSLSPIHCFVWDPTEPIATRPLAWLVLRSLGEGGYYTHDGNKNVSEVVEENGDIAARYDYAPFGAVIAQRGASAAVNPWRYSSEYADDYISLSYYNYRHYNFACGRWLCRDMLEEQGGVNLYAYPNNPITNFDVLGYSQHGCNNVGYTEFQGMSDDEIKKRYKALSMKGRRTPYENQLLAKLKTEEKARAIRRSRLSLRASSCRRGFVSPWGMAANLICSLLIAELPREFTQQIDVPPKSNPIAKSASCEKKDDGYWLCECNPGYTAWGAGDLSCKRFKNRPLIMCIRDLAEMPIDVAIALISNNSKQSNYNEQCPCKKEYDCE